MCVWLRRPKAPSRRSMTTGTKADDAHRAPASIKCKYKLESSQFRTAPPLTNTRTWVGRYSGKRRKKRVGKFFPKRLFRMTQNAFKKRFALFHNKAAA